MRYGSKVLFEDVTTTFARGRRYGAIEDGLRAASLEHENASIAGLNCYLCPRNRPKRIWRRERDSVLAIRKFPNIFGDSKRQIR